MSKKKGPAEVIVQLKYPIEWGSETISEVKLRRPKGKDIKGLTISGSGVGLDELVRLAGKLGTLEPGLLDMMDAVDVMEVVGKVADFFDTGPETGKSA